VVSLVLEDFGASVETRVAEVEIVACNALVTDPDDSLVAGVAFGRMDNTGRAGRDNRRLSVRLGLSVIWRKSDGMIPALLHVECRMLDRGTFYFAEAIHAGINCAAAVALVSSTIVGASNAQRQHRLVADGGGCDDPDRVLDVHESVHGRMLRDGEPDRVAVVAQVEIGADHTLVTGAGDLALARVAPVRQLMGGALVLGDARLANVASEWAGENRTETFVGVDGRFGWGALRRMHGLEGVRHVCVGGLDIACFHADVALRKPPRVSGAIAG
jgi:hypothetical protein